MHHILYWYVTRSEYRLRENEYNTEQYDSPAILHMHLLFAKPNPVFILQLFPLQYWQTGLQLKGVAVHWPLWHVSARVHGLPSSHATLSRLDHVLVLLLGLHHWKKQQRGNSSEEMTLVHERQLKKHLNLIRRSQHNVFQFVAMRFL